jgi:hypothetical protein
MSTDYKQLITEGIKDLPPELLDEIVDFVYLLRKRALDPQGFAAEQRAFLLRSPLAQLSRDETRHLEEEIADYEQRYPRR